MTPRHAASTAGAAQPASAEERDSEQVDAVRAEVAELGARLRELEQERDDVMNRLQAVFQAHQGVVPVTELSELAGVSRPMVFGMLAR